METGLYVMKLGGFTINHAPLNDLVLGEEININATVDSFGDDGVNYINIFYSFTISIGVFT